MQLHTHTHRYILYNTYAIRTRWQGRSLAKVHHPLVKFQTWNVEFYPLHPLSRSSTPNSRDEEFHLVHLLRPELNIFSFIEKNRPEDCFPDFGGWVYVLLGITSHGGVKGWGCLDHWAV